MNNTTIGVDLAKDVLQVRILSPQKIISNTEMNENHFDLIVVLPQKPTLNAAGTTPHALTFPRKWFDGKRIN